MKHSKYQSTKAKNYLINFQGYHNSDFFQEDGIWYLNCKDEVYLTAFDVYKNLTTVWK